MNSKKWNKEVFGNLQEKKKSLKYEVQIAQSNLTSCQSCTNEKELRTELESLEEQEQIFWMQKSMVNWIFYGDHNTRYYPIITTKKWIKRKITGILNNKGHWIENQ